MNNPHLEGLIRKWREDEAALGRNQFARLQAAIYRRCIADLAALAALPGGGVDEAARALVAKLEAVHADPKYMGVWIASHNHIGPYSGPNYTDELAALKAALPTPNPHEADQ